MKRNLQLAALALLGALTAGAGLAADEGGGGPRAERGRQGVGGAFARALRIAPAPSARLIERLDADEDGLLSFEEYSAPLLQRVDRLLERLDRDGNGKVEGEEAEPPRRREGAEVRRRRGRGFAVDPRAVRACVHEEITDFRPLERGEGLLAELGADGVITPEEILAALRERARERFDRLDADGDGLLSREELREERQRQRQLLRTARACASSAASD